MPSGARNPPARRRRDGPLADLKRAFGLTGCGEHARRPGVDAGQRVGPAPLFQRAGDVAAGLGVAALVQTQDAASHQQVGVDAE